MALSDYERKMLEQLEAQLADDDPTLAQSLATDEHAPTATAFSPKHLVIGLIVAVLGLLIVLGGVAAEIILVGVLGFVVVFAGLWYLSEGVTKVAVPAGGQAPRRSQGPSFMEQQMEQWRKRQQG
ncbi:DUF3040 domain-containing protein [Trueperella pecoris]|uniref:DUF3040 domain-containing protein n=1 Tax=Trueperella pecoris TaxID=2733571 RepID=A0A7M1QY11_9ACTO|nr:DUF3040 domain-containing protein [Trueperella pecoris]QOQ39015.1 DUF3040 domain-containing protein [Trueperella pecoris]QOR46354.1 DUF3040 domain-containing protein [Trueperella pecoris]QTG76180.1 DUF3040 domain-containing protein [Trueperella pecoris]